MISETPRHSQLCRQAPLPSHVLAELRLLLLSAPHTPLSPWEDLKKWPHFLMHKATCSEIISPTTRQGHLSFKWNNPIILQQMENHHPCIIPSETSVTCLWACVCQRVWHMEGAAFRGSFLQQRELEPLHSKQPGLWFSSARRTLEGWNHNELQDVLFVESPSKNGPQLQVLLKTIHIFIEFTVHSNHFRPYFSAKTRCS